MNMLNKSIFSFFFLFLTQTALAFDFDIWSSGITLTQAIDIAERKDIPLHKSGMISGNKHFNPSISRKYADTATEFYYKTDLLSKHATVTLHFTPASKKLYLISIKWENVTKKSPFNTEVIEMLTRKYGSPKDTGRDIFFKRRQWSIDTNNTVDMITSLNAIELKYIDISLEKTAKNESELHSKKILEKGLNKDSSKF